MANRITTAIRRIPEVDYTLVTVAGDGAGTQNNASLFVKLTPIEARDRDQFTIMAEVRNNIVAPLAAQGVRASVGGGGGRWRRWRAVCAAGAGAHRAQAVQRAAPRESEDHPRRGRCGHHAQRRQARVVGAHGSPEGRRSRGPARRRRRRAAAAGRR